MRTPKLSSRQRITLRIVLVLVPIWAVVGYVSARIMTNELYDRIDSELRSEAAGTAAALDVLSPELIEQVESSIRVDSRQSALIIVGPNGVVGEIPSGDGEDADPLPDLDGLTIAELRGRSGDPFTVDAVSGGARYRVVTNPLAGGNVMVTARPLATLDNATETLGRVVTVGYLVSATAASILVWVISRHALKPLEDVMVTASDIEAGTLGHRIGVEATAAPDVERLAVTLNTMLDRIEEAFADKERSEARQRQFVSDASHELRTPLAAIVGYAELYQQQMTRTPAQIDHAMTRIAAEAGRMQTLVEGLLTLARLDEGRRLANDAVDLAHIVDDAVATARAIYADHRFVQELAHGQLEVTGDPVALRQIIDNLLANVASHTPEGTVAHVTAAANAGDVTIVVSDNGPGMNPTDAEHAFDRFWRAERARSRSGEGDLRGSGLGLAIVDELVRAHGGTVRLDTAPGEGSTFTVRIPRSATAS